MLFMGSKGFPDENEVYYRILPAKKCLHCYFFKKIMYWWHKNDPYFLATRLTFFFTSMIVICPSTGDRRMHIQKLNIHATILRSKESSLKVH